MIASALDTNDLTKRIVSTALSVDPSELSAESQIYDFPSWDSLGQLRIVLALEERLNCTIDDEALFERLTKFAYIQQFVAEKAGGEFE